MFRNSLEDGTPDFDVFFGRINLKHTVENGSRELRGIVSRKIFKNLHIAMAILVLFEQFLGELCLYDLPLILMCFTKYDVGLLCSNIFDLCVFKA